MTDAEQQIATRFRRAIRELAYLVNELDNLGARTEARRIDSLLVDLGQAQKKFERDYQPPPSLS